MTALELGHSLDLPSKWQTSFKKAWALQGPLQLDPSTYTSRFLSLFNPLLNGTSFKQTKALQGRLQLDPSIYTNAVLLLTSANSSMSIPSTWQGICKDPCNLIQVPTLMQSYYSLAQTPQCQFLQHNKRSARTLATWSKYLRFCDFITH